MYETGTIVDVERVTLGSELSVDAALGATSLTVFDASDFDAESGGTVDIAGTRYVYVVADVDNGVLTVTPGLVAAASDGDRVDVWDTALSAASVEYQAIVEVPGDVDNADSVPARLASSLVPQFTHKLGQRDPGTGETVRLESQGGEWVVIDVVGGIVQVDGATLVPATVAQESLGFTLPDGTNVTVDSVAPSSPAVGDLWIDTSSGNVVKKWDGTAWVSFQFGTGAVSFDARDLGGVAVTFNATAPASPLVGDLWYDTDNGYQLAQWNGTSWVAVQFGTDALADGSITSGKVSFTARDIGGMAVTFAASAPASPHLDDVWYDTAHDNKVNHWDGTAWQPGLIGTGAIATGAITATLIAANTITAAQIAAGTITATELAAGAVTAAKIAANTITAAQIAANTITASQIAAGTITATQLAADSVTATQIAAGAVTASELAAGAVTAGKIAAGTVTATEIAAGTIVAGIVDGTTISGAQIVAHGASGEFLAYNGTPAAGNLIVAISPVAGTDAFGNSYPQGVSVFPTATNAVAFNLGNGGGGSSAVALIHQTAALGGVISHVRHNPASAGALGIDFQGSSTGLRVGLGPIGKSYYEEVALAAQSVSNGTALNSLANLVASHLLSDYGSAFNLSTGVWTCPVSGPYVFTLAAHYSAWANGSLWVAAMTLNGTGYANAFGMRETTSNTAGETLTVQKHMTVGDTVQFQLAQTTGSSKTLDPATTPSLNYISVRRGL